MSQFCIHLGLMIFTKPRRRPVVLRVQLVVNEDGLIIRRLFICWLQLPSKRQNLVIKGGMIGCVGGRWHRGVLSARDIRRGGGKVETLVGRWKQ